MATYFDIGDAIAGFALLLSAYATRQTVKFNRKQKAVINSQEKLNNLLIGRESEDSLKEKKADLCANFIKLGNSNYRLKIWNKGPAVARNVKIEFPEGNDVIISSEVDKSSHKRV